MPLASLALTVGSAITSWKWVPVSKASRGDTHSGWRNSDFGDMTTRGLRKSQANWRRNKWKKFAGVEMLVTTMLRSAQLCRKRSKRALECSGPWPS